jgi:hypothetical protein
LNYLVEVNADGEIEVEGKKVSQMLVNGKKFFEGDTKLGSGTYWCC